MTDSQASSALPGSVLRRRELSRSERTMGFAAGVVSAGLALAFGELLDGISENQPSLVVAVGELIADYTPGDVVATSIENLGSNQKWVLLTGITAAAWCCGP